MRFNHSVLQSVNLTFADLTIVLWVIYAFVFLVWLLFSGALMYMCGSFVCLGAAIISLLFV